MSHRVRSVAALAAVAALAVAGPATAAKSITVKPKHPQPEGIVKVTLSSAKVKQAYRQDGSLYADLTPPSDADDCGVHHQPTGDYRSGGKKASFRLDPNDAVYGHEWCQGRWSVRLYAMLDEEDEDTDSGNAEVTLARTSFNPRR